MKNILSVVTLAVFGLACGSCSDYLDREPVDFLSPDNLSTENDVIYALNGAYRTLILEKKHPWVFDFMVDVGYCNSPSYGEQVFWNGAQTPIGSGYAQSKWARNYRGVLRTNTVLEQLDQVVMSSEDRERYRGEAYVLRAYFYGDLIEFYGDVPLRLKPEGLAEKLSSRVDQGEILDLLLANLDSAIIRLPAPGPDVERGKMNKGTALALKARLCLYNKKYDKVIAACRALIDLGYYELYPSYEGLFLPANENNKEFIMTQQYLPNKEDLGLSGIFWTNLYAYAAYQVPYTMVDAFYMKDGLPSTESALFDSKHPFDNRDPRLHYVALCPFDKDGYGVVFNKTNVAAGSKVRKFVDYSNTARLHRVDGGDFPLIRYADVLLMLAEALVESGDYQYEEVTGLVDQIRRRGDVMMPVVANAEGLGGKILSQEELRQVIRHERHVEFPFEGLRWSDVKRWDIGDEVFTDARKISFRISSNKQDTTYTISTLATRTFNAEKGYLWPIPELETVTNPIPNNPGY